MITIHQVLGLVAAETGVPVADMLSPSRDPRTCTARDLACWLARRYSRASYGGIGCALGGRSYDAIRAAVVRIQSATAADPAIAALAQVLSSACVDTMGQEGLLLGVSAIGKQLRITLSEKEQDILGVRRGDRFDASWDGDVLTLVPGVQIGVIATNGRQVVLQPALPRDLLGLRAPISYAAATPRSGGGFSLQLPPEMLEREAEEGPLVARPWPAWVRYHDDPHAIAECRRDTRRAFA